ncbi:melanotransferrin isoform X3 [Excalfactoria chinensis]|uniref:melanotransferrin isoform X3 n=1 Tax=Excalfactoria chinensis TaxID=46218 RepID=UPI003B3B4F27
MKSSENVFYLLLVHAAFSLERVRWCTVSNQELSKCKDMSNAFAGAGILPPLECMEGESAANCTQMIKDYLADAVTLDGRWIYQAGKEHGLKPVVGEVYDQDIGTSYYAVAVVRKGSNITINSLKGVRSCHTGINRTAGWNVPVGYLVDSGRLPAMGCDLPKAVSDYFSASCVPGANSASYPTSLCQLCRGDSSGQSKCQGNSQEQYYGYSGAFRCLAEGAGEVAFVKHSTVPENTDGRSLSTWAQQLRSKDFQLLCRNGSTADVTEWRTCHLARVPARAVVVRPDTDGTAVFQLLNQGQQRFNGVGTQFQMFDSTAYGAHNLMFRDSTTELVAVTSQNYQAWLGDEYLHAMQALNCDPNTLPESLNWCVVSTEEIWKCGEMGTAFRNKGLKPEIQCISAKTKEECMEMIQKKEIDVVALGGADIYIAGKTYGLVPAAGVGFSAEDNNNAYYAVALVKRNPSDAFTINDLKGKKSCHTGLGRTAGWNIPIGMLIKKGFINPRDCNIPQAACLRLSRIITHQRSVNCVLEITAETTNAVQVAKNSITATVEPSGKNTESWARDLKSSDFQLLCRNGARAEVTQFARCHLAQVPAQAIMVHPDTNVFALYGLLDKAQDYFGNDSNRNGFKMFDSSAFQGKDLIFKDSAVKIVPVEEKRTYTEWLGSEYVESLEGMQTPQCSGAGNKLIQQHLLVITFVPFVVLGQIQGLG